MSNPFQAPAAASLIRSAVNSIDLKLAPGPILDNLRALGEFAKTNAADGRLLAILDSGCKAVADEYPGNWKQRERSKTIRTTLDQQVWKAIEHRVRRFLARSVGATLKAA